MLQVLQKNSILILQILLLCKEYHMISHLQHFFQDWYESFKTYYLSYMVAFIAAILWIVIIKYNSSYEHYSTLSELLSTCGIAFPLFLL